MMSVKFDCPICHRIYRYSYKVNEKVYGVKGTSEREQFDHESRVFCLAETLKEERRRVGLTQEQLAEKIGTKKTYISRLENGKADVQLSTLFRIFEGLGRRVNLTIL